MVLNISTYCETPPQGTIKPSSVAALLGGKGRKKKGGGRKGGREEGMEGEMGRGRKKGRMKKGRDGRKRKKWRDTEDRERGGNSKYLLLRVIH